MSNYGTVREPIPFKMLVGHRVHEYDPSSHAKPAKHIQAFEGQLITNEKGQGLFANTKPSSGILAKIQVRNLNYVFPLASPRTSFGNTTDVQVYAKGLADYENFQYFTAGEAFGQDAGFTVQQVATDLAEVLTSKVAGVVAVPNDDKVELYVEPQYNELVIQINNFQPDLEDVAPFVILDASDNVIYDPSPGEGIFLVGRKIYIRNNVGLNPVTLKY
jgi:hypothetical protein